MLTIPKRLWVVALLLGLIWDWLFWKQAVGLNFFIYTLLCLTGGYFLLHNSGVHVAKSVLLLIPIALFTAFGLVFRQEPFTSFLNLIVTLFCLGLIAACYQGGEWLRYGIIDYVANMVRMGVRIIIDPFIVLFVIRETGNNEKKHYLTRNVLVVLKGVVLAIPWLVIFGGLFASADLIFNQQIKNFMQIFSLERLSELMLRLGLILSAAYALCGVFLYAANYSVKEFHREQSGKILNPFLNMTESGIVLGSVLLLFAFFVFLQLRYLFGGAANIKLDGFTYAEYARRGFGELVVVAFALLLLMMGLATATNRPQKWERFLFNGLISGLVGLGLVILLSAYQRLTLYETAYGFSRLRTYTHVLLIWVGISLVTTLLLILFQHQQNIALWLVITVFGFVISLNGLNVDAFIVRQNLAREQARQELQDTHPVALDESYFLQLSADAIPLLTQSLENKNLDDGVIQKIAAVVVCFGNRKLIQQPLTWQAFNWGLYRAQQAIHSVKPMLDKYQIQEEEGGVWIILPNGNKYSCNPVNYQ